MLLLEAARANGVRPSTFILGADSRKKWDRWDVLLSASAAILERERCPQCGNYRWICGNEDEDIQFKHRYDYCAATAGVDAINESNARNSSYKKPPGERIRPEPFSVSGRDLADFREPYYKTLEQKRTEEAATPTTTRGS